MGPPIKNSGLKFICYPNPLLFLLILFSCISQTRAQFIFKPKKPVRTEKAWLDKYERSELKDSLPFSNILIVDSRYDTLDIGFVFSHYLELREVSPTAAWKQLINIYYHSICCLSEKDTLVIQLEKLNIQEDLIFDSAFICEAGYMKATLYAGHGDSYSYIGSIDTLIQEKYSNRHFEAHMHGKHHNLEFWDYYLLRLFDAAIGKAAAPADTSLQHSNLSYSLEEISKSGLTKRNKPILKGDSLHQGFYRDFTEFVNNNPTFVYVNEEALHNLLVVMHYRTGKNMSTEAPDTTYWGYCDGKNIYIRYAYDFFQLERKDDEYYLSPTLDANRVDGNRAGLNLLLGLAALSTSIAAKSSPELGGFNAVKSPDIPLVILKSRDVPIIGIQLDWDTGAITY